MTRLALTKIKSRLRRHHTLMVSETRQMSDLDSDLDKEMKV